MVRIIVHIANASMAANVGGPVQQTFKTFDIDHPELEKLLTAPDGTNSYCEAFVSGAEVVGNK
jgi:hypothetical protein